MTSQPRSTDGRDETPTQRYDRNWNDLLQELRIIQTGVQLLTGFLLTLPFQQRFSILTQFDRGIYLATSTASITATVFLQAPVVVHRTLFRRNRRRETVMLAHRLVIVGICLLGMAILGVTFLISSVVGGAGFAATAVTTVFVLLIALWVITPLIALRRTGLEHEPDVHSG